MKVIILAAGYATRLYPLTRDTPKMLLDVGGRPMIDWVLDALGTLAEIDGIYVVTNARFAPQLEAWAPAGVKIVNDGTATDETRLGAIGDIGFVLDSEGLDDDLIVIAGDNLFKTSLEDFAAFARERNAPVVAVHDVGDPALISKYNTVELDRDGRITFFEEKPQEAHSTLAAVAIYFYPRRVLPLIRQYLAAGNNPDQPGRLVQWLYPQTPFYAWELAGRWYDIGALEQLEEARADFATESSR
jgi:glucose-1-phosphate thymidylyltransferase